MMRNRSAVEHGHQPVDRAPASRSLQDQAGRKGAEERADAEKHVNHVHQRTGVLGLDPGGHDVGDRLDEPRADAEEEVGGDGERKGGRQAEGSQQHSLYAQTDEENRSRIGAVGQHAGDERSQDEPQRADPQHQPRGRFPDAERLHQRRQQRAHQDDARCRVASCRRRSVRPTVFWFWRTNFPLACLTR